MPTFVEYVGKRPTYTDNLYGTGDWRQGEIKPVHDLTARKMFRHADQYAAPKEKAPVETKTDAQTDSKTEPTDETTSESQLETTTETTADVVGEPKVQTEADQKEQDLQAARDAVQQMDKATLIDYAKTHFRQTLDGRASVEKTRTEVIRLIDQYGLD